MDKIATILTKFMPARVAKEFSAARTNLFLLSLVNSKPTWLDNEELKIKAKKEKTFVA